MIWGVEPNQERTSVYDMHKWPDDVEAEQVVLKISILIWEM